MKDVKLILVAAVLLVVSGPASAATTATNLHVSATIADTCAVSTTPVNFGPTEGYTTYANGDVTVTCPSGIGYQIELDAGTHFPTVSGTRGLASTGQLTILDYGLFKDASCSWSAEWGDAGSFHTYPNGTSVSDVGTGNPQQHPVFGMLSSTAPGTPLGVYTDTVTVTVFY